MKTLLDKAFALVQLNEENYTVEITWKKYATGDQYRHVIELAYEAIVLEGATKWLSDSTNAGVVSYTEQAWLQEVMIPKGIKSGLKKVAIVVSQNIFNKIYLDNIKENLTQFSTNYFDNIDDAHKWLATD